MLIPMSLNKLSHCTFLMPLSSHGKRKIVKRMTVWLRRDFLLNMEGIASLNCQFYLDKDNGWILIGEDEDGELEPFAPSLCIKLIVNMPQDSGVQINSDDERIMLAIMC